jgi:LCP family protein required for cell wall assembly
MKRQIPLILAVLACLLFLVQGCNLPGGDSADQGQLPTPFTFFDTYRPEDTGTPTATATRTPFPSPTPVDWPPPFFGTPGPTQITPVPYPAPVIHNAADFNVLLLGSDRRASTFATDVMVIVNIQPDYNTISLISVQRDFFVYIPGWQMNRVNGAFQHGQYGYYPGLGPALVKDTLLYNLGVEIDRYILVDFGGFEDVIDTLGGVDVPVACSYTDWRLKRPELDPEDEDNWHKFTVPSGVVHMDGDYALWYVRARKQSSDFSRNQRQQAMLRAIFSQALRLEMVSNLTGLYSQLSESMVTDFTMVDALTLAPMISNLSSAQVRSYYIDRNILSRWVTPRGREVQIPNKQALYALMAEALGPPTETELFHNQLTVEVWNGTNMEGWDTLASERLDYAGFDSTIGTSEETNVPQTTLYDFTDGSDPEPAQTLGALFNLDPNLIVSVPTEESPVDYLLILGVDFDPCFEPDEINR